MVSVEVINSTKSQAAYETTTSAHLPSLDTETGVFNAEAFAFDDDQPDHAHRPYTDTYDHVDPVTGNYDETTKTLWFNKKKQQKSYQDSWKDVIKADATLEDPDFDTGEIEAIVETAKKINSGELYPTDQIKEELSKRALALVPLAIKDDGLPAAQVESSLLRVVAVHPEFKDEALKAVGKIYDKHPDAEIVPTLRKIAEDTIRRTADVTKNPDDFIDLDTIEEQNLPVDRILEKANDIVMHRRINQHTQSKVWVEEDAEDDLKAAV